MDPSADKVWRAVKSKLTRAKNTKDPVRILEACANARHAFEVYGWPDWWARVESMETDAYFALKLNPGGR